MPRRDYANYTDIYMAIEAMEVHDLLRWQFSSATDCSRARNAIRMKILPGLLGPLLRFHIDGTMLLILRLHDRPEQDK